MVINQGWMGVEIMKVALMTDSKNISKEICNTTEIQVFEIEKNKIKSKIKSKIKIDTTSGGGYEGLLYILYNEGVQIVLCGEIKEDQKKDFIDYVLEVFSGEK